MSRRAAVLLIVAVLGLTSACGGDEGDATPDPTTTAPRTTATTEPATTTTPPTDEDLITQLEEDWYAASRGIQGGQQPADDANAFIADPYRALFTDALHAAASDRQTVRVSPESALHLGNIRITGEEAVVALCVIDADQLVDEVTGQVLNDDVIVREYRDTVTQTVDGWRITVRERLPVNEGAATCPAS